MPTSFEKDILRRRARAGKLVPLIEEYFRNNSLEVEDAKDRKFLVDLLEKRSQQRHVRGHYSPSQLGACMRAVYFGRTGKKRSRVIDPRAQGFFAQGNFMHLKWQFVLWKLHRQGKIEIVAIESYVENKGGDFSGHPDAIILIDGVPYVIDFKGYQPRVYHLIMNGHIPTEEGIQLTGYMMMISASKKYNFKVNKGLLVVESKVGPAESGSPLGLVEVEYDKSEWKATVKDRLRRLREYEANKETPPPACHSTKQRLFQTCPFSGHCLDEVREIQKREKAARSDPDKLRVAIPEGRRPTNSRKSRRRRG